VVFVVKHFLIILLLFNLIGCAGVNREIRYTVTLPGKIELPHVSSLAILDFAVPLGNPEHGRLFAQFITEKFQNEAYFRMIPPDVSRGIFRRMHVPRSRFREFKVIHELGNALGADALLFGDLTSAKILKQSTAETIVRQRGFKKERQLVIDAEGNTHIIWNSIPVYEEIVQETIYRTVSLQAEARLVRVFDGNVFWEDRVDFRKTVKSIQVDGVVLEGNKETDEALIRRFLNKISRLLIRDLLPRRITRSRLLADVTDDSVYADFIRKGNDAARKKDWNLAGNLWLQALALSPERPEAHANLGVLREASREFQQALKDYKFAAERIGPPWNYYYQELMEFIRRR